MSFNPLGNMVNKTCAKPSSVTPGIKQMLNVLVEFTELNPHWLHYKWVSNGFDSDFQKYLTEKKKP